MAKDKKGEGFHSAAGLIRYFDQEDEKSLKINPYIVIGMAIASAIIIKILSWQWPT